MEIRYKIQYLECEICLWVSVIELKKYRLDLMGVQVRWDKGGNESAIINEGEFSLHKRILLAILTVHFGSDRMLYVVL